MKTGGLEPSPKPVYNNNIELLTIFNFSYYFNFCKPGQNNAKAIASRIKHAMAAL
jgi:hypothetical protein